MTLKMWPEFYRAVIEGRKDFEIRDDYDRNFGVGDLIKLMEWCPKSGEYTDRWTLVQIKYITGWGQEGSKVVMGFNRVCLVVKENDFIFNVEEVK